MSTQSRTDLQNALIRNVRQLITGAILYNQHVADALGLHLTDLQCFGVLELLGPVTPGKLAEHTGLSTGGVTVMLDRLQKAGYVKRVPNPNDRRSVLVHVNPRKFQKVRPFYVAVTSNLEASMSCMPVEELETVLNFFSRMNTTYGGEAPSE
jgi:DNA-binding MarR family transcriptional regulator